MLDYMALAQGALLKQSQLSIFFCFLQSAFLGLSYYLACSLLGAVVYGTVWYSTTASRLLCKTRAAAAAAADMRLFLDLTI